MLISSLHLFTGIEQNCTAWAKANFLYKLSIATHLLAFTYRGRRSNDCSRADQSEAGAVWRLRRDKKHKSAKRGKS